MSPGTRLALWAVAAATYAIELIISAVITAGLQHRKEGDR